MRSRAKPSLGNRLRGWISYEIEIGTPYILRTMFVLGLMCFAFLCLVFFTNSINFLTSCQIALCGLGILLGGGCAWTFPTERQHIHARKRPRWWLFVKVSRIGLLLAALGAVAYAFITYHVAS